MGANTVVDVAFQGPVRANGVGIREKFGFAVCRHLKCGRGGVRVGKLGASFRWG